MGCRALSAVGAAAAFGRAGLITARAQTSGDYKALVCIFLFGGNDSNNLLVPNQSTTYPTYQSIRQNLAIPQASLVSIHDAASNATYGLHPSLAPIAPLYNTSNRLAIMVNVGTVSYTHLFEGMVLWSGNTQGPEAVPGTYSVRLTADGKSYTCLLYTSRCV